MYSKLQTEHMPSNTGRNRQGKYEAEHGLGPDEVLEAMDFFVPYTTGELANELGIPRRTTYKYLSRLHEEDRITKKKPEPRRVIWMRGTTQ